MCIQTIIQSQHHQQLLLQSQKKEKVNDGSQPMPDRTKKDSVTDLDFNSASAPQISDIQKVTQFFNNVSFLGSYEYQASKNEHSSSKGQIGITSPEVALRPMSYREKVSQLKGELRSLLYKE